LAEIAIKLIDRLAPGSAVLREQLRRAAFSVPLNIAEGTGKNSIADRKRYYAIAGGSAMECAAICDIIGLMNHQLMPEIAEAKLKLKSVVKILSSVCRND